MSCTGQAVITNVASAELAAATDVEALVREHARFVYRVAYSVLRNPQNAEDAVQETFLRVWKNRGKLAEVRDARLWLARIAWRVAVDRVKQRPEQALEEMVSEPPSGEEPADERLAGEQLRRLMQTLVAGLPPELREVVALSTAQEMTSSDMAEVLGIPESTVRTRLFRARQLLRERLAARLAR